jgi:AraC family transcriptional regulator
MGAPSLAPFPHHSWLGYWEPEAHLRLAPTLSAMAIVAALSPSHFARKFRHSTGFSLQRFINRRRVSASVPLLQANTDTLAGIAHDLGFSSQAHFTHLFSTLTGMTPAKYRKQFRRTVGWQRSADPGGRA